MRVAITTSLPPTEAGGVERQVHRLSRALEGRGHEVKVFAASTVDVGRSVSHLWGTRSIRQTEAVVRDAAEQGPWDVLVSNGLFGPVAWKGRRVSWFHSCLRAYAEALGPHMRTQYRWITSRVLGGREAQICRSGSVVAVSSSVATQLRQLYGAPDVRVVPNGIDLGHFTTGPRDPAFLAQLGVPRDRKVMVYVGRWEKGKGTDVLTALAAELAGEATLVAAVGGTAAAVPTIPNLVVVGSVPWHDLPRLYRSADCLVFPSYYEGFGLTMAEAAACGLPMVARSVGWAPDLADLEPRYAPFLLPAESDAGAFAASIRRLLREDTLRPALSDAGRRCVTERFDESLRLAEMVELVEHGAAA